MIHAMTNEGSVNGYNGRGFGDIFRPAMGVIREANPEYMTSFEWMDMQIGKRTIGVYRLRSAEGRLGIREGRYLLELRFTNVRDAQQLHDRIFHGTISPEISFEGPQIEPRTLRNREQKRVRRHASVGQPRVRR